MQSQAKNPSLSILIPAFNQGEEAVATLSLIASQIESWPGAIEVILSDNCSDSYHYQQVKDLPTIYPWLRIFRQEVNLGFKRNVGFLSRHAQFERCLILGCGDLIDLSNLLNVFQSLNQLGLDPAVIVSNVSSHSDLTELPFASRFQPRVHVRNWLSKWVPYQEAIPGQIYKATVLQTNWMTKGRSGDTWPHIDLVFRILSLEGTLITRTDAVLVSMHQSSRSWYSKPGANISALARHLAILIRNSHRGVGVLIKLGVLASQGLFMAISQDISAARKRH